MGICAAGADAEDARQLYKFSIPEARAWRASKQALEAPGIDCDAVLPLQVARACRPRTTQTPSANC